MNKKMWFMYKDIITYTCTYAYTYIPCSLAQKRHTRYNFED